jgi:diguanylate cyclase (GGDEF)-like protein
MRAARTGCQPARRRADDLGVHREWTSFCRAVSLGLFAGPGRRAGRPDRADPLGADIIDPLTSMLNRNALASRSAELSHQSTLVADPVGMIVCDVDRFEALNEARGQAVADRVLIEFSHRLRKHLRAFDLAYRLGSDDFVVLLPGATVRQTVALAEQLAHAVRSEPIAGMDLTASFGVAGSLPEATFRFETVFADANVALSEARSAGADQVCSRPRLQGPSGELLPAYASRREPSAGESGRPSVSRW